MKEYTKELKEQLKSFGVDATEIEMKYDKITGDEDRDQKNPKLDASMNYLIQLIEI